MPFWDRWMGRRKPPLEAAPATQEPPPDYPYPLVAVPGRSAVEAWRRLRDEWRAAGHSPVLLGDREYERYGAELYAMAGDVVECCVSRPPAGPEAAEALALEQLLYCGDIVDQGTEALLPLAAQLEGAGAWFFWWDRAARERRSPRRATIRRRRGRAARRS